MSTETEQPGEKPGVVPEAVLPPAIQPLPVTVIGVRSANTGAPITDGQIIATPDHQPNLVMQVISPAVAIAVRAGGVFLNTLLGGLGLAGGAAVASSSVSASLSWVNWKTAVVTAAAAAIVNVVQSLITIFGNLEKKHPLLTGSI